VARAAAEAILSGRPDIVVVQNYLLPVLEQPVYQAARKVDARLVVVIHDHRLHTVLAGNRVGLRHNLRRADVVATHSHYVARGVRRLSDRPVTVLPLPLHLVIDTGAGARDRTADDGGSHSAIHFGILKRRYKGTGLVANLAAGGVPGWNFTLVGAGAPATLVGAVTVPGFAEAGELMEMVGRADVALLPYSKATQSGAVALSQALGTVPVASAVGGIPEQIVDGKTGRLLPPGAGPAEWGAVLRDLASDPAHLCEIGRQAQTSARSDHKRFTSQILNLMA